MFGLAWNAFVFGFIIIMVKSRSPGGVYLFMLIFVAVGLAILGAAINMGWRRVLLAVTGDMLAYQVIGPFGSIRKQFHREDVAAIRVGHSGMSVGDTPVMELQIHLAGDGGKVGLLSQCSAEENAWVAAMLRSRLKVGR